MRNRVDTNEFVASRKEFWKGKAAKIKAGLEPNTFAAPERQGQRDALPPNQPFLVHLCDDDALCGVFEDEGDTGYLYIYDPRKRVVMRYLQVYTCARELRIKPNEVRILWSSGNRKCAVAILGQIRGIIDLDQERPSRAWMTSRESPGVNDADWLRGFHEHS